MSALSNLAAIWGIDGSRGRQTRLLAAGVLVACAGAALTAILANVASPVIALVGVVGIVVAGAMLASPRFAIIAVCFFVPFERIGRLTNDYDAVAVSVNRMLGVVALMSLLLHVALKKQKLRFGLPFYLYLGYTSVAILSNAWAYSPEETFRQCFAILGNLLFFFVVVNLVPSYAEAKKAVVVWLLATMLAGSYSLGDYYLATGSNTVGDAQMGLTSERMTTVVNDGSEVRSLGMNVRRLFGTTAHPTLCGLNNLMAVPFFIWAIRWGRRKFRLFWFAGLVVSVFCMVLSNTRAVFLLAGFTLIFCFWRGLWRPNVQAAISLAALGLAIVPFIPQDVYLRGLDPALYTAEKGDSIRVRFKFWAKSWELIQETWTHGIGVGNETTLLERITDENTGYLSPSGLRASAHNEYIWVMVEVGIVGYLLFWSFIYTVTRSSFRAATLVKRLAGRTEEYDFLIGCQVVMVGILLFALQSEAFHYPLKTWWLLSGICVNLLAASRARSIAACSNLPSTQPSPTS
jgi:hypothetical protein